MLKTLFSKKQKFDQFSLKRSSKKERFEFEEEIREQNKIASDQLKFCINRIENLIVKGDSFLERQLLSLGINGFSFSRGYEDAFNAMNEADLKKISELIGSPINSDITIEELDKLINDKFLAKKAERAEQERNVRGNLSSAERAGEERNVRGNLYSNNKLSVACNTLRNYDTNNAFGLLGIFGI